MIFVKFQVTMYARTLGYLQSDRFLSLDIKRMADVEAAEGNNNTAAKKQLTKRWTDAAMVSQSSQMVIILDVAK